MASVVNGSTTMIEATPFMSGVGFYTKGYLSFVAINVLVWMFVNSDVKTVDDVIQSDQYTELAKNLWFYWSVYALEKLLVFLFTIVYGNERDCESLTVIAVVHVIFAWWERRYLAEWMTAGIELVDAIEYSVLIAAGVAGCTALSSWAAKQP